MLLCLHFSLRQGYSMCYLYTLSVLINWDYWPLVLSGPCGFRPTVSYLSICTLTNSSWALFQCYLSKEHASLIAQLVKKKLLSFVLATPWTVAHQAPPSMGFPKQEYWSGLPFLSPGDLPDPGIKLRSPALQADCFLPAELSRKHLFA